MKKEEIIELLNNMQPEGDIEYMHMEADTLLLSALRIAGMNDVADAFVAAKERVGGFWYA